MQKRAHANASAMVHNAKREKRAIHGKALEEKGGLEAAFPGGALEAYTRLIWECFSRKSVSTVRKCTLTLTLNLSLSL